MKTESRRARNARLRKILRRGDPASGDEQPGADEITTMRREVLQAAPASPWLWRPALAGATVLALAAVALLWLASGNWPAPTTPPPPSVAVSEPATDGTADPMVQEAPPRIASKSDRQADTPPPAEVLPRQLPAASPMAAAGPPRLAAGAPEPDTVHQARTVQFQTPNGTRIIWTLNPELTLSGT